MMSTQQLWRKMSSKFSNPDLPRELRLTGEAKLSLIIHAFFQLGASMAGMFLNIYLWRLTEDLTINAMFNVINFAVGPFIFALGGYIAKRFDRMLVYRLGIVLNAIFYLLVIIVGERVPDYYILFAILTGIAGGFYWVGYLILQYDVSTDQNRVRYLAINMITFNSAGLLGPFLAGTIIQRMDGLQGYITIFIIAFIMFVLASVVSMRIKATIGEKRAYYLKYMGIVMKKNRTFVKGLVAFTFLGLFQGIMLFLPNILLFQALGREDFVGYLTVLFSLIIVAMGFVISKFAKKDNTKLYVLLTTISITLAASLLLFGISLWTVITFMVVHSFSNPLLLNSLTSYYYRIMGKLPLKGGLKTESVVAREFFLNTGRCLGILMIVIFAKDLTSISIPIIILVMAALQLLIVLCIPKSEASYEVKLSPQTENK